MKNFLQSSKILVIMGIFLFAGLSFAFKVSTTPNKITICHTPPGNQDNCQQISVSLNALEAHLNHGDNLICTNADELEAYNDILHEHMMRVPHATTSLIRAY